MRHALLLFVLLGSCLHVFGQADQQRLARKPLFVKAHCDGKLSSRVLASFKEAISASKTYELVYRLDANGSYSSGLIEMRCAEHNGTVAVASVYGLSHCLSSMECHTGIDGDSLNVALCDNSENECGQRLFEHLDSYLGSARPKFVGD